MDKIDSFSGEHRWLSNFAPVPIRLDGRMYPTVENAYQAAKWPAHSEMRVRLMECSPGEAKKASRGMPSWFAKLRVSVMYEMLQQKFSQEPYRSKLVATQDAQLIEGNTWGDTFWGVWKGDGQNVLGRLLMEIRSDLLHGERQPYSVAGSRAAPEDQCLAVKAFVENFHGVCRTGGAQGIDQAAMASGRQCEVYGLQVHEHAASLHPLCSMYNIQARVDLGTVYDLLRQVIGDSHYNNCSVTARMLHARNVLLLMGPDLIEPSRFLLAMPRPDGKGGTGVTIQLAHAFNIPVFTPNNEAEVERFNDFLETL